MNLESSYSANTAKKALEIEAAKACRQRSLRRDQFSSVNFIIAYETGKLTFEEKVEGFQRLIDCGLAWKLQGSYGCMASTLIAEGYCNPAPS